MTRIPFDPSLYLIAGSHDLDTQAMDSVVRSAVDGGVSLVQLREKHISTRAFINTARSLRNALDGTNVPLLINDRVDVALAAETAGVHIGQDDMAPEDARRLLGDDAIVGLTVHNTAEIDAAPHGCIDYLSIGGIFATTSKQNTTAPLGLDGLVELVTHARGICSLPLTAIAGINQANAAAVIAAGVDGVALISAIVGRPDPKSAAACLKNIVDTALESQYETN